MNYGYKDHLGMKGGTVLIEKAELQQNSQACIPKIKFSYVWKKNF